MTTGIASHAFDIGAQRIAYEDPVGARDGRLPVVLVHGSSVHRAIWAPVIASLSAHFRPISFDHPGHGESSLPASSSVDALTDVVERLCAALDIERAVLIGFSLGGAVAQQFHARHPDRLAALGLISTAPDFCLPDEVVSRWRGDAQAYAADEMSLSLAPMASAVDRAKIAAWRAEITPEGQLADLAACANWTLRDGLRGIACPLLAMTASHDLPALKAQAERWAEQVPGTRFVEIADAGHFMLVEQPEASAGAILDWLLSLDLER